jgi:hypothetical protein
MRASLLLVTLTATSTLVGVEPVRAHDRGRDDDRARTTCTVGRIFSPDAKTETARRRPRFRAPDLIGIDFEVAAARVPAGAHNLYLRLYTPQGSLYQKLPASFTVEVKRRQHHDERAAAAPLRFRLTLPGSPILTHSMYGRWKAEPYLDGEQEPCGAARSFWLESSRPRVASRERDSDEDETDR